MATLKITRTQASAAACPTADRSPSKRSNRVDTEIDPSSVVRLSANTVEALRDVVDDELYDLSQEISALCIDGTPKGTGYTCADVEAKAARFTGAARALAAAENGTIRAFDIAPLLGRIRSGHSTWLELASYDKEEPLYQRLVDGYDQLLKIVSPPSIRPLGAASSR